MKRPLLALALVTGALAASLYSLPAQAQATRTWVSGVGDDVNPCSRTAPCKTFAGAISKTAINGIINCLDPGGFGTLTIIKSITVDCNQVFGHTLSSGVNAFIINIAAGNANDPNRTVHLRNLTMDGAGPSGSIGTRTGLNGVRIINAATVIIENVVIQNFTLEGISAYVSATTPTSLNLTVFNSTINSNNGGGITIIPPAGVTVNASLSGVRFANNGASGLRVSKSNNGGGAIVLVEDSVFHQGGGFGIRSIGAAATVRLSNSVITGHATGISPENNGSIFSFQNNVIIGNGTNGTPTGTIGLD